jgi:hypothetical protein
VSIRVRANVESSVVRCSTRRAQGRAALRVGQVSDRGASGTYVHANALIPGGGIYIALRAFFSIGSASIHRMQSPSIIIRGETYPAELVRIVPMERGRLAIHLTTTCRLRLGESCNLRNAVGRRTDVRGCRSESREQRHVYRSNSAASPKTGSPTTAAIRERSLRRGIRFLRKQLPFERADLLHDRRIRREGLRSRQEQTIQFLQRHLVSPAGLLGRKSGNNYPSLSISVAGAF